MTPQRIQLRRAKGWRKPEGAIVVARPSKWGNPFRVGNVYPELPEPLRVVDSRRTAVLAYSHWLSLAAPDDLTEKLAPLRGRDLACWCPLDGPCHADVLLTYANPRQP